MAHRPTKSRLSQTWNNMKQRCYNPNASKYASYGGKGVTVCSEWLNDFQAFYDWAIKNGYADTLTIDRINSNKGYEYIAVCDYCAKGERYKELYPCLQGISAISPWELAVPQGWRA